MNETTRRFIEAYKTAGLNGNKLAKLSPAFSSQKISNIERDKNEVSLNMVQALVDVCGNVSLEYIMLGKGAPLIDGAVDAVPHAAYQSVKKDFPKPAAAEPEVRYGGRQSEPEQTSATTERLLAIIENLTEQNAGMQKSLHMMMERIKLRNDQLMEMMEAIKQSQCDSIEKYKEQLALLQKNIFMRLDKQDETAEDNMRETIDKCGTVDIDKLAERIKRA